MFNIAVTSYGLSLSKGGLNPVGQQILIIGVGVIALIVIGILILAFTDKSGGK